MSKLTPQEALGRINELRSNIIATQSASWSNTIYPLVAILNDAGMELFDSSEDQIADHLHCYGGAGGYPGRTLSEPGRDLHLPGYHARQAARHLVEKREAS